MKILYALVLLLSGTIYASGPATPFLNLVGAGDSRMAASAVPAGQGYLDYLATQPQFAASANIFNGAVSGASCASMTSVYAANVRPHKPAGTISVAYLFIEEGINDIGSGVSTSDFETCFSAYLAQAVSDGFTPVLETIYYWNGATDAQEAQRIEINNWIRTNFPQYLVIDADWIFPATANSFYYLDTLHLNGVGNRLWAQATNYLWGLGKSGTNFFTGIMQADRFAPSSGVFQINAALVVGGKVGVGLTNGEIISSNSATTGRIDVGSDRNVYWQRTGADGSQLNLNGGVDIVMGDSAGSYTYAWRNSGFQRVAQVDSRGQVYSPGLMAYGTKFTTSGCSVSSTTGGGTAGTFTLGANSCTVVITMNGASGLAAFNGWSCTAHDRTAPSVYIGGETSSTSGTASIPIPAGAGATDIISFSCIGY